ncbi:MAG: glycosyltransferase family 9 protein [Candidatus Omnitrophota bacterium]
MKIKYLRLLDKYLGFLLILAIHLAKIFSKAPHFSGKQKVEKILIIKFWGFGSIILGYDFFQAIRKEFPGAHICVLTLKQNRQVFEISGIFDEIIDIDIRDPLRFAIDAARAVIYLRKKSFDVSFDLEFSARFSACISCLINARRRVGFQYDGIWRGNCFSDLLHFREDAKLKDSYLGMIYRIKSDAAAPSRPLELEIGNEQKAIVDDLLKKESLKGAGPLVAININASELCLLRRWPKEYFVILAEELIKLYSARIIFIGSEEDFHYVSSAISLIQPGRRESIRNFAGKTSLAQLAYLMTKFRLFISNDSGPLHLAVYLKVPSVSFFGPETPLIYGPDRAADTVFYKNPGCSPCIRVKNYKFAKCGNNHLCLREIKPSSVLDEIRRKKLL